MLYAPEDILAGPSIRKTSDFADSYHLFAQAGMPVVRTFDLHYFKTEQDMTGNLRLADAQGFKVPYDRPVDLSRLKIAAETYNISPDYRDYIASEVPIVTADVPNRNMDAFSFSELTFYNPLYGCCSYQTFVGKGVHLQHDNQDPKKAKGIILDAAMRKVGHNWHVMILLACDRTKDRQLVEEIVRNPITGWSMGALVSYTTCSVCGFRSNGKVFCEPHIGRNGSKKGRIFDCRIAYEQCHLVNFIETSKVKNPADINAYSEEKLFLA